MKEKRYQFLFLVLVALGIALLINSTNPTITGYQTASSTNPTSSTDTATLIEQALNSNTMFTRATQGSLCIIIQGGDSFKAIKTGTTFSVAQSKQYYCDGIASEDFILKFNSYDDLLEVIKDPTPQKLISTSSGEKFQILPSRLVQEGGNVICDEEFKKTYCDSALSIGTRSELIQGDLSCCLDTLTSSEKDMLQQHYEGTTFVNEETPSESRTPASILGISSTMIFVLVFSILSVILLAVIGYHYLPKKQKEEPINPKSAELIAYVKNTLSQGYDEAQIKTYLQQEGWDLPSIENAFERARSDRPVSIPQQ